MRRCPASTRSQPFIERPRITNGSAPVDANERAALAARRDRHVPAHEECEPAEHLLLGHALLVRDQRADAFCKLLVICHAPSLGVTAGTDAREHPAGVRRLPAVPETKTARLFVLNLEGNEIAAITWFADSSVFPHFRRPRILR